MKYLNEYRNLEATKKILDEIHKITTKHWYIMEVCGGQTTSLVKNGIINMLPENIEMIHGPGCPVCVTPLSLIDKAVHLTMECDVILCSFGDMIRVPGSSMSLLEAKAHGADVRILYSPLEAVKIAEENPDRQVVFFAVGFETTAPINAMSVIYAHRQGLKNYSILASHVLLPPMIEEVMNDELSKVEGFLGAGHVCAIMGIYEYYPLVEKYKVPIVITGFEPLDLVQGIYMVVKQLEAGEARVENQYSRIVKKEGNVQAQQIIYEVFEVTDRLWRGMEVIPMSGYKVKDSYRDFDAEKKFNIHIEEAPENPECVAGEIMKGIKKPFECQHFGKKCKPANPLGAPMVSSEGACAAYYYYSGIEVEK